MDKGSLKAAALKERIAQLVAQYEDQIADMRAEVTQLVERLQDENNALRVQVEELSVPVENTTANGND